MTSFDGFLRSARKELPEAPQARCASVLFSLSVLALPISLTASQAFLAASAVAYALHLLRDRRLPVGAIKSRLSFPPLKLPLALFCLLSLISAAWAGNPAGWLAMRKLVLFLVWLLAVNLLLSSKHLALVYKALFLESTLAGLVAAGQFVVQYRAARALHPQQVYFYMTLTRVHGFMGHWMNFGGQQMLVFAALLSFLLLAPAVAGGFPTASGHVRRAPEEPTKSAALKGDSTGGSARKTWWVVLAVVGISIVLSFTRGVWLGCLVALVYVVGRRNHRWLWALPAFLIAGYLAAPTMVRQRVEVLRHPTSDPSLSIRFEMWQVALRMVRKHPLVGVGPNNIERVYALYLPPGRAPVRGYHQHLHNNFLQLAAERGLPCVGAWVWLMGALAWHFARIRRQLIRGRRPTWVAEAAMAAWLGFVVEGCFEFNFGTSPVLMLFLFVTSTPFVVEKQTRG